MNRDVQVEYPVYCSWCEREGIRTVVGTCEVEHSSGCCPMHARRLLASCGILDRAGVEGGDADQGHE